MKKVFLAMLVTGMLAGPAFATGGNKTKKASKSKSAKAECPPSCDKSKCADMPCCK